MLMFSSKSFIVSGLLFRSLIHFEFIFVYGVRECSSLIILWSEKIICMISVVLELLRFVLWAIMWSIPDTRMCTWEEFALSCLGAECSVSVWQTWLLDCVAGVLCFLSCLLSCSVCHWRWGIHVSCYCFIALCPFSYVKVCVVYLGALMLVKFFVLLFLL